MLVGRYRLVRRLNLGLPTSVWLAEDTRLHRLVAVKVLPCEWASDPVRLVRFEHEARLIALLEHPFIVPLYDFGYYEDCSYLVMRYMTGGTLADWAGGRPRTLPEVLPHLIRIAQALDALHDRGWVHRAVHPRNVLLDSCGEAYLADLKFSSRNPVDNPFLMRSTALAYLSPEQAIGCVPVSGRVDVYSFGMLAYELLTGTRPFAASTLADLLTQHHTESLRLLPARELGLPPGTDLIVAKAMAQSPFDRFARAGDFIHALSLMTKPMVARSKSPWQVRLGSLFRRHPSKSFDTTGSWRYAKRLDPHRKAWRRTAVACVALGYVLAIALVRWPCMVAIGDRLYLQVSAFASFVRTLSTSLPVDSLPLGR
ncbi:MAG: serine/threonine protein kinase [Gammaproteobacteria bacterium]|nr:serine/threonine protein kinase [Gammaproteobacteria bacterium]